jgi:sulfonate transport system substrate-binding protein
MPSKPFLKIGGVPEHFNLPWILALEKNKFRSLPVELSWNFYPGGTGAMTQALKTGELDIAILLTEGFMASYYQGLSAKIIHAYIQSPLQWGIYSGVHDLLELNENTKIAISRNGSGSHLMSMLHAQQLGVPLREDQFIVVHHLEDAIESLKTGQCDYFYWEHWMTLKYVQQGEIRQVGRFSAPWSGFLVVASEPCLAKFPAVLSSILSIVTTEVQSFIEDPNTPDTIAQRFQLNRAQSKEWLGNQKWNFNPFISKKEIQLTMDSLKQIGQPVGTSFPENIIAPWLQWKE